MLSVIKALLHKHGIEKIAALPLDACRITKPYLLHRASIESGTVIIFCIPYYTTKCEDPARNISAYAVSADYHLFCRTLFDEILPILQEKFPENRFAGFADHSPIDERDCALRAGLGSIGKNHLFQTREFSSFVFLAEIVTDAALPTSAVEPISLCTDCGACLRACPAGLSPGECLSALTQQKGALTGEQVRIMLANGSAWGCDRCQDVCPVTKRAKATGSIYSDIPFFHNTARPVLRSDDLLAMDDTTFSTRAYSWRGRETILRNLKLFEEEEL